MLRSIFNFPRFAQAQLRKTGQITSLSTSQSAVFALCRSRSSKTINWSADSFQINHVTSVSWHMSPPYGHGILVSGYPVLTAVNWPYWECPSPAKNVCACSTKNDTWSISGNVIGSEAKIPAKCCWDERSWWQLFLALRALQFHATVRDQKLFWSKFWRKCVL